MAPAPTKQQDVTTEYQEETTAPGTLDYKRTAYEVRMDALDAAIRTNSDNRSIGPEQMVDAAVIYEKFLSEVNTGE